MRDRRRGREKRLNSNLPKNHLKNIKNNKINLFTKTKNKYFFQR